MPINGLTPTSQTKMDTGYQLMDLHQSPKTNMDTRCQSMDLFQSSKNDHRKQMPINGLTIDSSHTTNKTNAISKRKQVANKWSYTRLQGNRMPINGLSPNSFQIIGTMANKWTYN